MYGLQVYARLSDAVSACVGQERPWGLQVTERSWRFLVADVAQVAALVATSPTPPCLYETMLAGVSGLRMFFDIEYCIQMNATRVAAGLDASIVPEIVQQVDLWLARFSQAKCTVDRKASVVLAASDAVKFSVHVILHFTYGYFLPGMPDAKHCAEFVSKQGNQKVLSVIAKDGSSACVIDTQVYGNNQQYRCM